MSGYGFRLYTVKLVEGRNKSKPLNFNECGMRRDQHVSVWVRRLLKYLEALPPLTGQPINFTVADEEEPPPMADYIRSPKRGEYRTHFLSSTATPPERIFFKFNYGRTGKVSVGIENDQAVPLGHIPTGDTYRGILFLPLKGTVGVLALESIPSAPNPQRMLNQWLTRAALELEAEDKLSLEGLTPEEAAGAAPSPFKLNFNQYPNLDRIEKAVERSPVAKVVLKQESISGSGDGSDGQVTISSTLGLTKRAAAATLAGQMYRRATGRVRTDDPDVSLDDLEGLLEGSLDGFEWTDGYIQIDDDTGLKKIGLDHIDKFFIYPSGSGAPLSDAAFLKSVAQVAVDLQSVLKIELTLA